MLSHVGAAITRVVVLSAFMRRSKVVVIGKGTTNYAAIE